MVMAIKGNIESLQLASQMRQIRETWSESERLRRAELSQQRQRELLDLLVGIPNDPGHWAVGAPDLADLKRMAS